MPTAMNEEIKLLLSVPFSFAPSCSRQQVSQEAVCKQRETIPSRCNTLPFPRFLSSVSLPTVPFVLAMLLQPFLALQNKLQNTSTTAQHAKFLLETPRSDLCDIGAFQRTFPTPPAPSWSCPKGVKRGSAFPAPRAREDSRTQRLPSSRSW